MRVATGFRKTLITPLALNAALASVQAQADQQPSATAGIWGDSTDVTLGLAAVNGPRYLGSKRSSAAVLPQLRIERGIFFFDLEDGLGLQWQAASGFAASASIGRDAGRADGDSQHRHGSDTLAGMGAIGGASVLNLQVSQPLSDWLAVRAKAELRTGGEQRGDQYALGFVSTLFAGDRDRLTWSVDAHAGSARFNQTYFGVNAAQSRNTGFARYSADQGIYAYSSELSWLHAFDAHWSSVAGIELSHYTDQVRNSPIITRSTTATSYLGVNYSF
ncbi:MipA/OmpV family protein [Pseudomonas muyukensis]|uniref:MipA/OmpV family protein n=1 Tax=Pseudomonas muyukensis TaxID=2842357 RepID=A0ABX8M426_9PSED|nr:MipA/OmpV family protein [Pseudomonas muyukensis]QXH33695.1 MipA/OmpV family protein [Pseudomonas muyukensis]